MQRHLVVFGGTGFVGRQICKQALKHGFKVTSISKRGIHPSISNSSQNWISNVTWEKGDALEPSSCAQILSSATDIVHSIGILRENLAKGLSYQRINCDSAVVLAKYAGENCKKIKNFAFISANPHSTPRGLMRGYFRAKEQAETELSRLSFTQIYKPSFMYGSEKPLSFILMIPLGIVAWIARKIANPWHILPSAAPMKVESFALQIIEGLERN